MLCRLAMQNNSTVMVKHHFAPAKINLYLHVTGQRPDGYHELDSLVAFASIGDEISVVPAAELTLQIVGPEAPALQGDQIFNNLVLRAARALAQKFNVSEGASITLNKMLPVASGIGGGSADAAATLNLLNDLWGLKVAADELAELALGLGADVPVCLNSRPQRMTGIGEKLHETPAMPASHLVLVNPRHCQATPDVFAELHKGKWKSSGFAPGMTSDLDFLSFVAEVKMHSNDLEPPAIRLAPVIKDVLSVIGAQTKCRLARMSGSGATCFGMFEIATDAQTAAVEIRRRHPDWWVQTARLGDETPDLRQAYTG
jgi:4-diphosphocytidyl-2-C-methyl-D-erythritol kinase